MASSSAAGVDPPEWLGCRDGELTRISACRASRAADDKFADGLPACEAV